MNLKTTKKTFNEIVSLIKILLSNIEFLSPNINRYPLGLVDREVCYIPRYKETKNFYFSTRLWPGVLRP